MVSCPNPAEAAPADISTPGPPLLVLSRLHSQVSHAASLAERKQRRPNMLMQVVTALQQLLGWSTQSRLVGMNLRHRSLTLLFISAKRLATLSPRGPPGAAGCCDGRSPAYPLLRPSLLPTAECINSRHLKGGHKIMLYL